MAAWSASGVPPQAYCAPALSNGNQAGCVHLSKERNDSPGTGSVPVSGIMRCRPYCSQCDKPSPGGVPPQAYCAPAPGNRAKADCIHSGKERNGCGGSPPAAAPADYLQVISASCRNNTPPKLQKSPGEISGGFLQQPSPQRRLWINRRTKPRGTPAPAFSEDRPGERSFSPDFPGRWPASA